MERQQLKDCDQTLNDLDGIIHIIEIKQNNDSKYFSKIGADVSTSISIRFDLEI